MNKKGIGLGEAAGAVLTLVLIAVLVIVGIYLFVSLQGSNPVTGSTTNETIVMTGAAVSLANASSCGFVSATQVGGVYNNTDLIPATNYTFSSAGTLVNKTNVYGTSWKVSYSYIYGGAVCLASNNLTVAFGTFPALIGLVGTIIFLGIVIGVLIASFVFRRRPGA